jgi:dipeptidyl aminopeptidase/acylaminoacyl peptidase
VTRAIQPRDILNLRSASDAQPSPDGRRIAYVVTELDRAADKACSSIWCIASDGSDPRRVSDEGTQPRWSPDGRRPISVAALASALPSPTASCVIGAPASCSTASP